MARVPLRNTDMRMDYVNVPKTPSRHSPRESAGDNKLLRIFLLSFGLLCMLQATLNVSLRIFFYTTDAKATELMGCCNNQTDQIPNNLDQYFSNGWVHFGASLYYISTAKKSWQDSQDYCVHRGANLIVINSKEEQEFTRKFHRFMWIGLEKKTLGTTYGTWTWVDGTPLTISYWARGEPNMGEDENCVQVRVFEVQESWNDLNCEDQNDWICEKAL